MIWRSTLVFLTSLTALTVPVGSLPAQSSSLLMAQSSAVDPNTAIDTGQAVPNFDAIPADSPLQGAASEQQIEEIKAIQQELKKRGFYNGPIDGIYGPATAGAIQTIRGQGGQPLFPSEAAPDSPPDKEAGVPEASSAAAGEPGVDGQTNPATEKVEIGQQVSPATGVDSPETNANAFEETTNGTNEYPPADAPPADAPPADAPSSPGLGRLLWPGLALIAALGSFGIGFILSNRPKPGTEDDSSESPWGVIPNGVPQGNVSVPAPSSFLGHVATNGGEPSSHNSTDHGVPQPNPIPHHLSTIAAAPSASATTRLARVDVMDELVANLQVADPTKRRKAIWELGQRGNSSAVQHLVNSMVDADSKEKSLILAALSEIGIRSLKPLNRALAIALQDDNPDVRKNAIRDLTRVYDLVTQISQMLGHATEDEDPEVRRTAEWALGQLNRIREAPKLKSSINTLEGSHPTPDLLPDGIENLKN
ncbi:HEAT repeat domain-containing protein [Leptothoe sp. PORK10 BA2]|uniref:HEAT repeat domain-containing protein n=1 Tax=Leptothoe sp. PORK10 BA2 TaxID=3110254 RepID=UPI002B20B64F|nr:HEAT repeat domain-containing protein [Leptothoe sp. PORK10 BA2]MEA5462687.1 HEAT repeat domain-containing protein [Leptothoe sp. PORK10 BA2]